MTKNLIFGTREIGGLPSYKKFDEKKAIDLLQYAYQKGIRIFDTAPIYGNGNSEILLGKALKDKRYSIKIITKFGIVDNNFIYTQESIRNELNNSLERLQTDYIDIYLLHIPEGDIPIDVIINTLEEFKEIGKIKSYGVANCQGKLLEKFIEKGNIEYVQDFYNLMFLEPEKQIFPYLNSGQSFMSYSPLYRGLLTNQSIQELLNREEGAINRLLKNSDLKSKLKRLNILKIIAIKQGVSITELAYKFLFEKSHVESVLIGTTSKKHLDIAIDCWKKYS